MVEAEEAVAEEAVAEEVVAEEVVAEEAEEVEVGAAAAALDRPAPGRRVPAARRVIAEAAPTGVLEDAAGAERTVTPAVSMPAGRATVGAAEVVQVAARAGPAPAASRNMTRSRAPAHTSAATSSAYIFTPAVAHLSTRSA